MVIGIYFSPTGGTRAIADHAVQRMAQRLGTTYRLQSYTLTSEREAWQPIAPGDFVIWASPVYAGKTPNKMLDFVRQAIQGHGNKGAAIAVFGNRNYDNALAEMTAIMARGRITPIAAAAVVSRHPFDPQQIGHGRPSPDDYRQIDNWIDTIDLSKSTPVPVPGDAAQGYYQPLRADGSAANFLKAKPQIDIEKCSRCGICATVCPMGSIAMTDGTPSIQGLCIKCHACIRHCPTLAAAFSDADFLSHVQMLRRHTQRPAQNAFFG